jgi:2'-phosphotransferase
MSSQRDVRISKALSYLLRHGAEKEKLAIDEKGYVALNDILNHNRIKCNKATLEDIKRIVEDNDKKRFTISGDYICANQGHSLKVIDDSNLELLTKETIPQEVFHGTYKTKLGAIIQSGGLSKMNRNHIHFTSTELSNISGIRKTANVLIYLDVNKCLQQNIEFFKSKNDVILSAGDENGFIRYELFDRVIDTKTGQKIDITKYLDKNS